MWVQLLRLSTIMKEVCMLIIPISALLVGVALVTIIAINKAGFLQNFQLLGKHAYMTFNILIIFER